MAKLNILFEQFNSQDILFVIVSWGIIVLLIATLATLMYLLLSRGVYKFDSLHKQGVINEWQPIFNMVRRGEEPLVFPAISRRNKKYLLDLWLEQRQMASKQFGSALENLADRIQLDETICNILQTRALQLAPRHVGLSALAIDACRYIDTPATRELIKLYTKSENMQLAAKACACMASTRTPGFEKAVMGILFRFPGNIPAIFDAVSKAGGADVLLIVEPFLNRLPRHTFLNFINLVANSDDPRLQPFLVQRLQITEDKEEIAELLRLLSRIGSKEHLDLVRPFLQDEAVFVRIQAIRAFGNLAGYGEIETLLPFLSDLNWWIRYRAARAIVKLCDRDAETIEDLVSKLDDTFAKEILQHAYTEMEWCLT